MIKYYNISDSFLEKLAQPIVFLIKSRLLVVIYIFNEKSFEIYANRPFPLRINSYTMIYH